MRVPVVPLMVTLAVVAAGCTMPGTHDVAESGGEDDDGDAPGLGPGTAETITVTQVHTETVTVTESETEAHAPPPSGIEVRLLEGHMRAWSHIGQHFDVVAQALNTGETTMGEPACIAEGNVERYCEHVGLAPGQQANVAFGLILEDERSYDFTTKDDAFSIDPKPLGQNGEFIFGPFFDIRLDLNIETLEVAYEIHLHNGTATTEVLMQDGSGHRVLVQKGQYRDGETASGTFQADRPLNQGRLKVESSGANPGAEGDIRTTHFDGVYLWDT